MPAPRLGGALTFLISLSLSLSSFPPVSELSPEEKAQRVARAIRKQAAEVRERWERLLGHVGGWHEQVERSLEKLQDLQSAMDQLDVHLSRPEEVRGRWQPVGDLLIDSLQDHIDKTTVSDRGWIMDGGGKQNADHHKCIRYRAEDALYAYRMSQPNWIKL